MLIDGILSTLEIFWYRQWGRQYIDLYNGSEINPFFQEGLAVNEFPSFKFIATLTGGYLLLWLTWLSQSFAQETLPVWEFISGMAIFIHLPMLIRHMRWLVFLSYLKDYFADKPQNTNKKSEGNHEIPINEGNLRHQDTWIEGKIRCSPSYYLRQYSIDYIFVALITLFLFAGTGKILFAGASLALFLGGSYCWMKTC